MDNKPKLRELPIRVRRTLHADGESTSVRTVFCPTRGQAVAVGTCGECGCCERITADRGGHALVQCRPEAPRPTMRYTPLLRRILPSAADRVAIADLMQRDVTCVSRDVSLETLTRLFVDRGIGASPVVDGEGYPIGIVSKSDLVREGMHRKVAAARTLVGDLMMPLVYTLCEDEPLSRAAAVMDVERVHHLPVVAADGRVVGILSSLDFVHWVAAQSGYADQA